jgi:hypothetical protein
MGSARDICTPLSANPTSSYRKERPSAVDEDWDQEQEGRWSAGRNVEDNIVEDRCVICGGRS